MAGAAPERQVRISRIAGRYLVFDIEDVVHIRRHHGICAVLTGTMPQNPTQNLFLGLPVELHAEEARLLVDRGAGYVADELAEHLARLTAAAPSADATARRAYLRSLRRQRRAAQLAFEEERAAAMARHQGKRTAAAAAKAKTGAESAEGASATAAAAAEVGRGGKEGGEGEGNDEPSLFDSPTPSPPPPKTKPPAAKDNHNRLPAITPTTSGDLVAPAAPGTTTPTSSSSAAAALVGVPRAYPLYRHLNARGYYTTPGLRFGGDYSVYPGDPFRYHAHYLANSYGWDEAIPMLDLVTSGRLGTAVKKSFLFGAEKPKTPRAAAAAVAAEPEPEPDGSGTAAAGPDEEEGGGGEVRVFCVEWAGM